MHWRLLSPLLTLALVLACELVGVFEVHGDGLPQAGLEVNGVFTYDGRWGLMNIPRCRGENE